MIFNTQYFIFHHIFPTHCLVCTTSGYHTTANICDWCFQDIEIYPTPRIILIDGLEIMVLAPYKEPLRTLIKKFKYQGNTSTLPAIYKIINQHTLNFDLCHFIPVPMHWTRKIKRGIDHTYFLARHLSQKYQNSYAYNRKHLSRLTHTPTQEGLSKKDRLLNPKKSFTSSKHVQSPIILIDDVLTTGSTLLAARYALKYNSNVKALVLAKS